MTLQDDRFRFVAGNRLSIKMTVGATAVKEGAPVTLASGVVTPSALNDSVFGIAEADGAIDGTVAVNVGWGCIYEGEVVASSTTLAVGDICFLGTVTGTNYYIVKDGATGQPTAASTPLGVVILGAASGAKAQFIFLPKLAFTTAGALTVST